MLHHNVRQTAYSLRHNVPSVAVQHTSNRVYVAPRMTCMFLPMTFR